MPDPMPQEGVIKFTAVHQARALEERRYGELVCKLIAWREILGLTGLVGQAGDHETIATVIAGTADHQPAPRQGPAVPGAVIEGLTGPGHQRVTRDTVILDRGAIQGTALFGGV